MVSVGYNGFQRASMVRCKEKIPIDPIEMVICGSMFVLREIEVSSALANSVELNHEDNHGTFLTSAPSTCLGNYL